MYLVEALKYNVPAFHEDRLTQVVAATFAESKWFQKTFLKFLGVPYRQNLTARTQVVNENAPSRPDLIIFAGERPYVLVESKVAARADRNQQNLHALLGVRHCFLMVRDPVQQVRIGAQFKKIKWGDFFSFLLQVQQPKAGSIDGFLVEKLIEFGKECNMLLPDRILQSDFESASTLLSQIRLRSSPFHSFEKRNPFQSLDVISLFLERALIRVKDDPFLGDKLKTFIRRLEVSSLFYEDLRSKIAKEKDSAQRQKLRTKSDLITIQKEIRLRKPIKGMHFLYVRATFIPFYKGREVADARLESIKKIDLRQINYRCEISAGLSDLQRVSTDLKVFKDESDLEFSTFYAQAIKSWKRKLATK